MYAADIERIGLFLSHLSGDEVRKEQGALTFAFLSHLSGDEGIRRV